jgi:beta-glucosidase
MSFPKNFFWGAATASAQIEGGWDKDGRSPSVWDVLPGNKIKNGDTPHVGCNHYEHWREDVGIMKELGLKAYRFSISWSRVIPRRGEVNPKGLQFYIDLVDTLVTAGVEPMVTLFHWDLPVWAVETGGYDSGEFPAIFAEYAKVVVEALSDKVKYWFTFNEPQLMVMNPSYEWPDHDNKKSTRNIMLAHGEAVDIIRKYAKQSPKVGIVIMGMCAQPVPGVMDENTARGMAFDDMIGIYGMAWWLDPIILGTVPAPLKETLSGGDIQNICRPLDFFAGNIYFAVNYLKHPGMEHLSSAFPGMPKSAMGSPITPECLYWFAKFTWERYKLPILITENGFTNIDFVMSDGKVHDPQREDFIRRYLLELEKAVDDDIPVLGYLYWSFLDNFDWNDGFDPRYGLVYVDYRTQKRTVKDSGRFYAKVIETNGGNLAAGNTFTEEEK